MFHVGKKVEVLFDDSDAWFPATIDKVLESGAFLVECTSEKDGEAQTLKVAVDSFRVRPSPPPLNNRSFKQWERVEVYFDFGWWSGVITQLLEGGTYNVSFKLNEINMEFSRSDLRQLMEWKDEKWIISSELSQKQHESAKNHTVEVAVKNSSDIMDTSDTNAPSSVELYNPVYQKSTKLQSKRKQPLPDSVSQPLKKHNEGNTVGSVQKDTIDGSIKQTLCTLNCASVDSIIMDQNQDRVRLQPSQVTKQRTMDSILNEGEKVNSQSSSAKKSRTQMLIQDASGEKEVDVVGLNGSCEIETVHPSIETQPVIIGLPCTNLRSPGDGISMTKRARFNKRECIVKPANVVKHQLNGSASMKSKNGGLSGTGELSGKKRRGRPSKVILQNPETPPIDFLAMTLQKTKEINSGMEVDKEVASGLASNGFKDQPLSRWIGGINSLSPCSSVVGGANKGKSTRSNVEQSKEKNKFMNGASTSNNKSLIVVETFPFVKNSCVWEMIESMEVLKRMPQTPHFRHLLDVKEIEREGWAVGHMVTFCNVVEKVSKLRYNDDKSISNEILETLAGLEIYGFDVSVVWNCVIRLQALKDRQENIRNDVSELNNQISLENDQSMEFEKAISEIDEQIQKLQEKRSSHESAKRKVDELIAGLKANVLNNEEMFKSGQREYDRTATIMFESGKDQ